METETARNLPAKLVSLRKQKGITQMEVARETECFPSGDIPMGGRLGSTNDR
jgi:hypothetical protein